MRGVSARPHETTQSYSTSPASGNQVDDSPLDCHMETIGKLTRLRPTKNGELVTIYGRVNKALIDEVYEDAKKNLSSVC